MNAKVYRIGVPFAVIGIVGLISCCYIILYTAGLVPWRIFQIDEDLMGDPDVIRWGAIANVGCLLLVWQVRLKVTLDETGILYRGMLRSVYMRWADITRVDIRLRSTSMHLWANQRHLEIITVHLSPSSDLKDTIVEYVQQNSPDAVVDRSPIPFWPQKRKGRPTPRDEEA